MADATDKNDSTMESKFTDESAKTLGPVEQDPLLSPKETNVSESDSKRQDNEMSKPPTEMPDNSFKKPMIGPLRKPSNKSKIKSDTVKSKADQNKEKLPTVGEAEVKVENIEKSGREDRIKKEGDASSESKNIESENEIKREEKIIQAASPAEQTKQNQIPIPYLEPKWGGSTDKDYSLEVLKNGSIINTVKLTDKSFYVFGRLPACDVQLEHPSLSRFHAVLQYCAVPNDQHEIGWYLYDLESTHGTCINKLQVKPRMYYRVRVGFVLKFAGSSRLHILQGPAEDEDEESELTVTEMKEERQRKKMEEELAEKLNENQPDEKEEDRGCTWGMTDDAVDPEAENPFAEMLPQNEELYLDDPKKTLKGFFEREGYDLPEYQFEEAGHGKHKCIVEVPVDSPTGQPVYAEAVVTGKRKDAVIACALEACRVLDRYGLLRKKEHEAKKAKTRSWEENDYYSSDEDEFLDRTGEIQKKRAMRMKRAGKLEEKAETFESLSAKLEEVVGEMERIEKQLQDAKKDAAATDSADLDALDAYMSSIKKGAIDTKTRMSLKRRLFDLRKERGQIEKLINVARPALIPQTTSISQPKVSTLTGKLGGLTRKIGGSHAHHGILPKSVFTKTKPIVDVKEKSDDSAQKETQPSQPELKPGKPKTEDRLTESTEDKDHAPEETKITKSVPDRASSTTGVPEDVDQRGSVRRDHRKTEDRLAGGTAPSVPDHPSDKEPSGTPTDPFRTTKEPPLEFIRAPDTQKTTESDISRKRSGDKKKEKAKKQKTMVLSKDYAADDPDYAVWVPPEGQTGDGITHLNAKYGY